jgi:hypothetical protein
VPSRRRWPSVATSRVAPPALPSGLRRREAAACAAMALGLINSWAVLAGPFSPMLYPLDTVLGQLRPGRGRHGRPRLPRDHPRAGRPTQVVLAAVAVAVG